MPFSPNAETIFSDGPTGAPKQPYKPDIRAWGKQLEAAADAIASGAGTIAKQTLAQLNADLGHAADVMAWVYADSNVTANGIYRKIGASGSGSWVFALPLPYTYIVASNSGTGTPNAIKATSTMPILDGMLVSVNITVTNTLSPVTIAFNSQTPFTVKTRSGFDVAPGDLTPGYLLGVRFGAIFYLLSDTAVASLIYAARDAAFAARDDAQSAQAAAEAARDIAAGYASDAVSQGNVPIYGTVQGLSALTIPLGINAIQLNGYALVGDDGAWPKAIEVSNSGPLMPWQRQSNGGSRRWQLVTDRLNPQMFGADAAGVSAAQVAFGFAAQFARTANNTGTYYADMPRAESGVVYVTPGHYKLTDYVDTAGSDITWIVDTAVVFVGDCAKYLAGRIVRPNRIGLAQPGGSLDQATGLSVIVGMGLNDGNLIADAPPAVGGFINPDDIGASGDTGDIVAFYAQGTSSTPIAVCDASYDTSTQLTVALSNVDPRRLRKGQYLLTKHSTPYKTLVASWSVSGSNLVIATTGWRQVGVTGGPDLVPPNDGSDVIINASNKVWAANFNLSLQGVADAAPKGVIFEGGIFNNRTTSASYNDLSSYAWGADIVDIGSFSPTNYYIARGRGFAGYLAAGQNVGFLSAPFAGSYGKPAVGFKHVGGGAMALFQDAAGNQQFSVTDNRIEIGTIGVSNTPALDFHSGGTALYNARLSVIGGGTTTGDGPLLVQAAALFVNAGIAHFQDNAFAYGAASNRATTIYLATAPIVSSDPRLKRFLDEYNAKADKETWNRLRRAVSKLPVRIYQELAALSTKGEDARFHIGVSAKDVEDVFASEGLDPRRFALFCEDDEFEQVEVEEEIEIEETESFEETYDDRVFDGENLIITQKTRTSTRPKTKLVPVIDGAGNPILVQKAVIDADGNPVMIKTEAGDRIVTAMVPATAEVPVTVKTTVKRNESRPTGAKRLSIRYEQLAVLMIGAMKLES